MYFRNGIILAIVFFSLFPSCSKPKEAVKKVEEPVEIEVSVTEACPSVDFDINALPTPSTLAQKFSYVYGVQQAENLLSLYDLDAQYIAKGVLDGASGTGCFSHEESQQILTEYLTLLQANNEAEFERIKSENLAAAEKFLAVNKERNTVKTTDSGLQYEILREGKGRAPIDGSVVKVQYQLMLLSGEVVDSSYSRGDASSLSLSSNLVPGFKEAVLLMKEGEKIRAWLNPSLGYGVNGATKVKPNELLIFDIELISIE